MPKTIHAIVHTHALHPAPLDNDELRAALGVGAGADLNIMRLEGACDVRRVEDVDWRAEQLHLAAWFEKHEHKLKETAYAEVAYFGATCIPLAMDLGARLGTRARRPRVFHQRHGGEGWTWPGRAEGDKAPEVRVTGLPEEADPNARGPVVVCVASSYSIADVDLETMRRGAIATVRIDLDPIPLDHNPYSTQEELERTVAAFGEVLSTLQARLPGMNELRVAVAGPVGLILRLGGSINPTIYPPVTVWNYSARQTPKYQAALRLGRTLKELTMKQTILFLAADASGELNLPKEHSHIKQRLLEGKKRDQLDVATELATQTKNFIAEISRANPTIVHFAGHSDTSGALVTIEGNAHYAMAPKAVAAALAELNHARNIKLVVLNACHTKGLQDAILEAHAVDHVIAMTDVIGDPVAIEFATELYRGLSDGLSIERAFRLAKAQCQLVKLHKRPKDELFSLSSLPYANPDTTRLFE